MSNILPSELAELELNIRDLPDYFKLLLSTEHQIQVTEDLTQRYFSEQATSIRKFINLLHEWKQEKLKGSQPVINKASTAIQAPDSPVKQRIDHNSVLSDLKHSEFSKEKTVRISLRASSAQNSPVKRNLFKTETTEISASEDFVSETKTDIRETKTSPQIATEALKLLNQLNENIPSRPLTEEEKLIIKNFCDAGKMLPRITETSGVYSAFKTNEKNKNPAALFISLFLIRDISAAEAILPSQLKSLLIPVRKFFEDYVNDSIRKQKDLAFEWGVPYSRTELNQKYNGDIFNQFIKWLIEIDKDQKFYSALSDLMTWIKANGVETVNKAVKAIEKIEKQRSLHFNQAIELYEHLIDNETNKDKRSLFISLLLNRDISPASKLPADLLATIQKLRVLFADYSYYSIFVRGYAYQKEVRYTRDVLSKEYQKLGEKFVNWLMFTERHQEYCNAMSKLIDWAGNHDLSKIEYVVKTIEANQEVEWRQKDLIKKLTELDRYQNVLLSLLVPSKSDKFLEWKSENPQQITILVKTLNDLKNLFKHPKTLQILKDFQNGHCRLLHQTSISSIEDSDALVQDELLSNILSLDEPVKQKLLEKLNTITSICKKAQDASEIAFNKSLGIKSLAVSKANSVFKKESKIEDEDLLDLESDGLIDEHTLSASDSVVKEPLPHATIDSAPEIAKEEDSEISELKEAKQQSLVETGADFLLQKSKSFKPQEDNSEIQSLNNSTVPSIANNIQPTSMILGIQPPLESAELCSANRNHDKTRVLLNSLSFFRGISQIKTNPVQSQEVKIPFGLSPDNYSKLKKAFGAILITVSTLSAIEATHYLAQGDHWNNCIDQLTPEQMSHVFGHFFLALILLSIVVEMVAGVALLTENDSEEKEMDRASLESNNAISISQ